MSELNKKISGLSPAQRAVLNQRLQEKKPGSGNGTGIARRTDQGPAPLSFAQERLWFLDQFEPNNAVYNIPLGLRLKGELNVEVLQRSLDEIMRRHEALRTRFETVGAVPVQVIEPPSPLKLPLTDLSSLPEKEREAEATRLCREEAKRPFDLKRDLMLRVRLFRLGPTDHILLLSMHHIASDGWSMGVMFRELRALYAAFSEGKISPLPELPIQYADYAVWQRQRLRGELLENQLSYWRKQLEGAPERMELPIDRPRPAHQTYRGTMMHAELPGPLATALRKLSRAEGVTLFMTLLTAFQILLHRYTGLEDIVVGSAVAGRSRTEVEGLAGFFVNTLALRGDLSGNPTFQTLLHRTGETALAAFAHQDLPFEKLVEVLRPQRDMSHSPLFQVMLVLQNATTETAQLANLEVTSTLIPTDTSKFDLTLSVREVGTSLELDLEYSTDLFETATISRLLVHYRTLLEGIVAKPEKRISDLPLLTEGELHELLIEWNQTERDFPRDKCLHEIFEQQVERTPDAVAVTFESERLTYRELNARSNQLAHYLRKLGVGPETMVGISVERSLEMIIGLLGILKAGGAYVPLDPTYPSERLAFLVADSGIKLIVTQQNLQSKLSVRNFHFLCLDGEWEKIARESTESLSSGVTPENLAYVIYTSGSTGHPKGALLEHRGVCNLIDVQVREFGTGPGDCVLQFASISFDASVWEIFPTLAAGATLCLAKSDTLLPGPDLVKLLREKAITTVTFPPAVLNALSEADLPALRTVGSAGEACTLELAHRWGRGRRFINGYGPTETTVGATLKVIQPDDLKLTIGRPFENFQIYILDRQLQPVPIGVAGELHVGGAGLARGYHNRPELTAEKFIPNPFSADPKARLYKTGDLARYLPNGEIEYLGRLDFQVKIRGFRVELGEIEEVLNQHPAVQTSVVVGREDTPGDKRLIAYLVSQNGAINSSDLREALRSKLPEYMVPAGFVMLDALPLSPNGKVNRKALPQPNLEGTSDESQFTAPSTETEIALAEIWCRLLGLKQISTRDSFFDLGGHSLLAVRLFAEIQQRFGVNLRLSTIFEVRTLGALAELIRKTKDTDLAEKAQAASHGLIPIRAGTSERPLFVIHSGDGNVLSYEHLARYLPADLAIYGLESRGLTGLPLDYDVESVAWHFIEKIRERQPHGPYFVIGHCFGGLVAYEIAQQLSALNEEMGLVGLVDSFNRNLINEDPTMRKAFREFARKLFLRRVGSDVKSLLFGPERVDRLREIKISARTRSIRTFYEVAYRFSSRFGMKMPAFLRDVKEANRIAGGHYWPDPYNGTVVIFRCQNPIETDPPDSSRIWQRFVKKGMIIEVPGDHNSMLREPGVRTLADQIKSFMRTPPARALPTVDEAVLSPSV